MNAVAPVKLHSTFPKLQRLLIFIAEQVDRSFYGGYLIWHSVFKAPAWPCQQWQPIPSFTD